MAGAQLSRRSVFQLGLAALLGGVGTAGSATATDTEFRHRAGVRTVGHVGDGSIQAAVDDINTGAGTNGYGGVGKVFVPAVDGWYDETVVLNKRGITFEGQGINTYLRGHGNDHTIHVMETDITIEKLWVDSSRKGSGSDAIHVDLDECIIRDVDIDSAPRYGLYVNAERCMAYGLRFLTPEAGQTCLYLDERARRGVYDTIIHSHANGIVSHGAANIIRARVDDGGGIGVTLNGYGDTFFGQVSNNKDGNVRVPGRNNVIVGYIGYSPAASLRFSGDDNAFMGWVTGGVEDTGDRNLINGNGRNHGHPGERGAWNGHGPKAHSHGAVVWDVSESPAMPYRADPFGNWVDI